MADLRGDGCLVAQGGGVLGPESKIPFPEQARKSMEISNLK